MCPSDEDRRGSRRRTERRVCARSPWLPRSLSVLSPSASMPVDPASTALYPQSRSPGLQGPAMSDTDFRNRASSNFSSNIVSEFGSTNLQKAWSGYRPRPRAMISFWISVVPPKIGEFRWSVSLNAYCQYRPGRACGLREPCLPSQCTRRCALFASRGLITCPVWATDNKGQRCGQESVCAATRCLPSVRPLTW
jgi:hypothetical protein